MMVVFGYQKTWKMLRRSVKEQRSQHNFLKMKEMIASGMLSERTITVTTYALCGFTSVASIAILIGGITGIAPNQKKTVVSLGIKALIAGLLTNFMTATIAGILV